MSRVRRKIVERQVELRKKLWPTVTDEDLWLRLKNDGFSTLPRSMPLIMSIMDGMNKGHRVSAVYLDLWCTVMDEMFVQLKGKEAMAFYAGFEGERALRTWRDRMRRLANDGFIGIKPGPFGEMSYAIIYNPYHVIRRHYDAGHPSITESRYTALMARAHEVGASDFDVDLPDDPGSRKPSKKKADEAK